MSTINGVPAPLPGDQADTVADRRRPGRASTENPHLIELMRGTSSPLAEVATLQPRREDLRRPAALVWVVGFCVAVWVGIAALCWWL
jgi:hypothetical protein